MNPSDPSWLEPLWRRLETAAPEQILLLAPPRHPVGKILRARFPRTRITTFKFKGKAKITARRKRSAFALVANVLESMKPEPARELLGALRDRLAHHTLLWVDTGHSPLPDAELRGLGYRLLAHDGTQALYGFDPYDYKDIPEWLNLKDWAHPELWNQHRW